MLNSSDESLQKKNIFKNINIEAAYIHIISDIILSVGVIISAIIIFLMAEPDRWTYWQLADPFCTYFFSIVAIYSTIGIIKESFVILLDGCNDPELVTEVKTAIEEVEGIEELKDFKLWTINREKYCAAVSISVKSDNESEEIKRIVKEIFVSREIQVFIEITESGPAGFMQEEKDE